IWLSETTVNSLAGVLPKDTPAAPLKPEPVIVTSVPPLVGAEFGLTPVTTTADPPLTNVNWSAPEVADVPAPAVTLTCTVRAVVAAVTAVICVSETTVNELAARPPKLTALALVKPEPVIVTLVPPLANPERGLTPTIVAPPLFPTYVY